MTDTLSELDLMVGSLLTLRPDEDHDAFEEELEVVSMMQDQLREEGVVIDLLTQPGVAVWEKGIENLGALYQLSRLATRLERQEDIRQVLEDGPVIYDEPDRTVTDVWDDLVQTRFPHLVHLQGINSYYLPVDFAHPVWLPFENHDGEEDEVFFGSAVRLQRELTDLAELLHQADVPTSSSAYRCLETLQEAAAQSLHYHLPVIIW